MHSFHALELDPSLVAAIQHYGLSQATPIQSAIIPAILEGKDALGIAPTGSGKTASFVWPLLMNLQRSLVQKNRHVQVLVLVPTRELAGQVKDVFQQYSPHLHKTVKTAAVFGGVSINPQMKGMMGVNVLVATPGRLLELVDMNAVHLSSIETLVLDEADKMLHLGFEEEMKRIFALLPKKRQNLLFSATLNERVEEINRILLHQPLVAKVESEEANIDSITQLAYAVTEEQKGPLLRHLIRTEAMQQVLIFTSSVYKADAVTEKLKKNGITARAIHSKKSQGARTEALLQFKQGKLQALVTTDLMARGIDIPALPYVINYELPRSPKDYVHRIGRTGRASEKGTAITFVTPDDQAHFKVIQKKMGKWVNFIDAQNLTF